MNELKKTLELNSKQQIDLIVKVIKQGRTAEFKTNPKLVIEEILGYKVPENLEITVLDETKTQGYLVLPELPEEPESMSDEDLFDMIAKTKCRNTGTHIAPPEY